MALLPGSAPAQPPGTDVAALDSEALRAAFDGVADMTVGLEEEVLLVDRARRTPAPCATELLDRLPGERFKLELPAAQLEILTPPLSSVGEAAALLAEGRRALVEQAGGLLGAIGCGAAPTGDIEGELNAGERYEQIVGDYRAIARRQLVCALQVHVAVRGADRALDVYNALRSYLPCIAALAANAPFHAGRDTGMASIRPPICTMLPRQGVPPRIASWESYVGDLRWGATAGSVLEARRWWWELRPHPGFGTLEVRVADAQITPADTAAVAAFVHCLVGWLAARFDAGEVLDSDPAWRIAENRWSACRDGVEGSLADLTTGETVPTRTRLEQLLADLGPVADRLGVARQLQAAASLCEANGAIRQRAVAAEHGVQALVDWLAQQFAS